MVICDFCSKKISPAGPRIPCYTVELSNGETCLSDRKIGSSLHICKICLPKVKMAVAELINKMKEPLVDPAAPHEPG